MNILGRARRMIQGLAPPEPPRPQYYQVACPEGHILRGMRTEGYQALRCPECGRGIFVLPRSPLPEPPAPPAPKSRARPSAVEAWPGDAPIELSEPPPQVPDAEIEWLEPEPSPRADAAPAVAPAPDPAEAEPMPVAEGTARPPSAPTAPKARAKRPGARPKAEARRPRVEAGAAPAVVAAPAVPARIRLRDWARRRRLPLILAGAAAIVAATVVVKVRQGRLEDLPHIAEVNRAEGLEALEQGRFDIAKVKLGIAARALERLGARDARAVELRQVADEAAILADLPDRTLEEILEEAVGFNPPEDWPSHFEAIYLDHGRGRYAVLIDSTVKNVRPDGFDLDYQVYAGRGPRPRSIGRIAADDLSLFKGRALKDGQRLLFGARLTSLTLEGDHWRFGLDPESGVLMNQFQALQAIGLGPLPDASESEARP